MATTQTVKNGNGHRPSRVPLGETKPEAFIRLAEARVARALMAMEQLGKLAVRRGDYSPEQAAEITEALAVGLTRLESRFAASAEAQAVFRFTAPGPQGGGR